MKKSITWGYCRVSTEKQDLSRQIAEMKRLGIPDQYILTEKISGTKPMNKRPVLRAMFEQKLRPGDTLCVVSVSRLSREVFHFLELLKILKEMGVHFKALDMNIDPDHPIGKFLFNIMGAVSQLQVDFTRYRTIKGLEAAKRRGTKLGRPTGPTVKSKEFLRLFNSHKNPFEAIEKCAEYFEVGEQTIRRWAANEGIQIPKKGRGRKKS